MHKLQSIPLAEDNDRSAVIGQRCYSVDVV